jgi:hypothetical protein
VIDKAVSEKLERLEAKRYGKVRNPRKSVEDADTAAGVRGIPAPVKRFVWKRDGGQCTFRSADGRRCTERHRLEFHHDDPYAFGGDRSPDNICLMCKPHNLYMAERDYGRDLIDHYWGSADRAREPGPTLELPPERVDVAGGSRAYVLALRTLLTSGDARPGVRLPQASSDGSPRGLRCFGFPTAAPRSSALDRGRT